MNRQQVNEIIQKRTALIRTRILKRLLCDPAHAQMGLEEKRELADKLAKEAMSFDQPGYNSGDGAAPATPWDINDEETNSARFNAALLSDSDD